MLLAPLAEKQALEADVRLRPHHFVVSRRYQPDVEKLLSALPKRRRPAVQLADDEHMPMSYQFR